MTYLPKHKLCLLNLILDSFQLKDNKHIFSMDFIEHFNLIHWSLTCLIHLGKLSLISYLALMLEAIWENYVLHIVYDFWVRASAYLKSHTF